MVEKSGYEYDLLSANWRLLREWEPVGSRAAFTAEAYPGMIEHLVARLKLFQ